MKLNLGCGIKKMEGYLNCDLSKEVKPDKIVDLEKQLPFKDNSIEEVVANHVLEHVNKFIPLMHELHRISKNGALLKFRVPFFAYPSYYSDPTHVRFFTPFTFDYFVGNEFSHEVNSKKGMFYIKKRKLNFSIGKLSKINKFINPIINLNQKAYMRFFSWIFPAAEIEFELLVKK